MIPVNFLWLKFLAMYFSASLRLPLMRSQLTLGWQMV